MPRNRTGVFNAEEFVRPGLSIEEVNEIKEAFDFFDVDGNGEVSVREFVDALRSYGFDTKNPEIYQMIADMDEDGKMTNSDFVNYSITPLTFTTRKRTD